MTTAYEDKLAAYKAAHPKSNARIDAGGTIWITDREGSWPIINGWPYYGPMVYDGKGNATPLRPPAEWDDTRGY